MAIVEMTDRGIAANKDELVPSGAEPERLQQPEKAFDRYVHDVGRRLLASGEVYDMSNIDKRRRRDAPIGDRAAHHLDPVGLIAQPVMTKGTYARIRKSRIVKQPSNEVPPDLARSTGNKGKHALLPATANIRVLGSSTDICTTGGILRDVVRFLVQSIDAVTRLCINA
jgi:hypothetical protein